METQKGKLKEGNSKGETRKGEPQTGKAQKAKLERGTPKVKLSKGKVETQAGSNVVGSGDPSCCQSANNTERETSNRENSKGKAPKGSSKGETSQGKNRDSGRIQCGWVRAPILFSKQAQAPKQHYRHPPKPNNTTQPTKHHPRADMCRCRT